MATCTVPVIQTNTVLDIRNNVFSWYNVSMKTKDIQEIVGEEYLTEWLLLNPIVYYKDQAPYGVIGTHHAEDNVCYIASSTRNPSIPFTKNMIRDIIRLYKQHSVCLISGDKNSWGRLASALSRYHFTYTYGEDVMYAHHFKEVV